MRYSFFERHKDAVLLIARVLLMLLFVIFGWQKLTGFSGTVSYMTSMGIPLPQVAAAGVVVMEFFVAIALMLGVYTRPLAFLMALYTLATAFIGHHYWNMPEAEQAANMINFYKNISIVGGLLLLCVTGPGKYSVDKR